MKKQLICFILSILLCLNLVAPALANQSDSSAFLSKSGSTLVNNPVIPDISAERIETQKIELDSELNAWMVINIYSNATTDFFLVQDGEVLTSAHLDKKSQQVTETRYSNNKIIKQSTITYSSPSSSPETRAIERLERENVGTIGYLGYSQGYAAGTVYLKMGYLWESGTNDRYTFYGNYDSIATMVALISGYFSMDTAGATPLVRALMGVLGLSVTVVGIVFASAVTIEDVDWYRYTWTATNPNVPSQKASIKGTRYQATFPNGTSWVDYSGTYYTITNYTTHDTAFARAFFWKVYSYYDSCDVVSWT